MKRILTLSIAISASAGLLAVPTFATTVNGNRGSIVKVSGSCSDLADVASNNRGSIVKIDGGGQCDINEILKGSAVENNRGSIIHISNVCGNKAGTIQNNRGSIVKIDTTGPCDTNKPTTAIVMPLPATPATETPKTTPPVTTTTVPTEMPKTGAQTNAPTGVAGLGLLSYMTARYLQSRARKLAE